MVGLDQLLGGKVGEHNEEGELERLYNEQGDLIRQHGALFDSPLHFIGHSRGTVVNSEIIQRLGTDFPEAGGVQDSGVRDLQMTTIDPHDFKQESLQLAPGSLDWSDFWEPEVRVWENVTFADNYYQTVDYGNIANQLNPLGREIEQADVNVLLNGRPGFSDNALTIPLQGIPHLNALAWYAGTLGLDIEHSENEFWQVPGQEEPEPSVIYDHLGEQKGVSPTDDVYFYMNASGEATEGTGTGWFHSVQGGGDRPQSQTQHLPEEQRRTEVDYDNTHPDVKKSDDAVPGVFNGDFDVRVSNNPNSPVPGWYLVEGGSEEEQSPPVLQASAAASSPSPTPSDPDDIKPKKFKPLPENTLKSLNDYTPLEEHRTKLGLPISKPQNPSEQDVALLLKGEKQVETKERELPNKGDLRLDLFSLAEGGSLEVSVRTTLTFVGYDDGNSIYEEGKLHTLGTIELKEAKNKKASNQDQNIDASKERKKDLYHLGYGLYKNKMGVHGNQKTGPHGLETFTLPIPDSLRGRTGSIVLKTTPEVKHLVIDNIAFRTKNIKFGNPTKARYTNQSFEDIKNEDKDIKKNVLLEKPQYTVSYNAKTGIPNWSAWQLNQAWLGKLKKPENVEFVVDKTLASDWPGVSSANYPKGNGYDKGHLAPSGDRNRNLKDQLITYMGTNIIPQAIDNNRFGKGTARSAWLNIERMSRQLVEESGKELYIVAGGLGKQRTKQTGSNLIKDNPNIPDETNPDLLVFNGKTELQIPKFTWKTILALDTPGLLTNEVNENNAEIYTFLTPNLPEPSDSDWKQGSVVHPFADPNFLLEGETISNKLGVNFPNITSVQQWRSPNTWRISVKQLEFLLNDIGDFNTDLNWDLFSKLLKKTDNNIQEILESKIFDLPPYGYRKYPTPNPQP